MSSRTFGGFVSAIPTNVTGDRDVSGLDAVLRALRALPQACGSPGAPPCCTVVCCAVVDDVRDRALGTPPPAPAGGSEPDTEFEAVLVRRLAGHYLRVVADGAQRRSVPLVWQLLLDPPAVPPVRLALAGVAALLHYDLTLAAVGACTVLGRTPGARERDMHHRVAVLLGTCARGLVRRVDDPALTAAAARLDGPVVRAAAWAAVERLWTLRGRPAEAEKERAGFDREVRADILCLLAADT